VSVPRRLDDLGHAELAVLVREYLLGGQLIDRAGMPHVISRFGRDGMAEIAIEEWMGASPIYTRRTQSLLGFEGDTVETIFKGMQFDIGAPPEFMDFRYRVHDDHRGEFWLDHCGALMDVEPMGADYVHAMCHTIEDPTFDATAWATNPRARMRPVHRPPRAPEDRHPHCHWTVEVVEDAEPLPEPGPATLMRATRIAQLPLTRPDPGSVRRASRESLTLAEQNGEEQVAEQLWEDYSGPLDPDLRTERFTAPTLLALAQEVAVQWHLLVISFLRAIERRADVETAVTIGARQFAGVGGVVAGRLRDALDLGAGLDGVAQVLELHPAFQPRSYVDWRVEVADGDRGVGSVRVHLGECEALRERGVESWLTGLAAGTADAALDAIVRGVDPRARCVPGRPAAGDVATWEVVLDEAPAPVSRDVELTRFSTGAAFEFTTTPVVLGRR